MNKPINKPSVDEISAALKVLNNYWLHYYQLLYFEQPKLTAPGSGRPFNLRIDPERLGCIRVSFVDDTSYDFHINSSEADQDLLAKCRLVLDAHKAKKTKVDRLACCPLATFRNCVCNVSFNCPVHGQKCVGTHD